MTVRLRPHHLLCVLTYAGGGYSRAFTAGFDLIAARIGQGENIALVAGPDDICAPLLADETAHCRGDSAGQRDRDAAEAVADLLARESRPGAVITLDAAVLARLRAAFASGAIRKACAGCEWAGWCSAIAADRYRQTRLAP